MMPASPLPSVMLHLGDRSLTVNSIISIPTPRISSSHLAPPPRSSSMGRVGVLLALLALSPMLFAASPASAACAQPYAKESLIKDLVALQAALRGLDEEGFKSNATRLAQGMECLDSPVPAAVHARAYRYMGALAFIEGNSEEAVAWFRTSLEIDSAFQWDIQDFDAAHPVRQLFEAQRGVTSKPTPMEEAEFVAMVNERILVDGREARKPIASPDRNHIVQKLGPDGKVKHSWRIQGNQFPVELLVSPEPESPPPPVPVAAAPPPPKPSGSLKTHVGQDGVMVYEHPRSSVKTPLLAAGGAQLLLAGVAWGYSFVTHGDFDKATTSADIQSTRKLNNTMVLTSGVLTVTGLATGFVGLRLNQGVGVRFVTPF